MYKILYKKSFFILANLIYAVHIQAAEVAPTKGYQEWYVTESINNLANIFADKDVQNAIKKYFNNLTKNDTEKTSRAPFDQDSLPTAIATIQNANIKAILRDPQTKLLNFRTTILYKIKTLNLKSYVSTADQLTALLSQAKTSDLDKTNLGKFLALNQNLVKDNIKLITEKLGKYNPQDVILVAENYISKNGELFLPLKKLVSEKITAELTSDKLKIDKIITLFDNKKFTVADYFKLGNPPKKIMNTAIEDIFVNANIEKILTKGTPNLLTIPGVSSKDILSKLFAKVNGETNETDKENLIKFLADKNNAKLVKDNIKLISDQLANIKKFTTQDIIKFAYMNRALFVGPLKNLLYQKINERLLDNSPLSVVVRSQLVNIFTDRAVLIDYVKSIKNFLPNSRDTTKRDTTKLNKILSFINEIRLDLGFMVTSDPEFDKLQKLADPRTITQKIIDFFKPTILKNTARPPEKGADNGDVHSIFTE